MHGRQRGAVTLLSSPDEVVLQVAQPKPFLVLVQIMSDAFFWRELWPRRAVLQICDCVNPASWWPLKADNSAAVCGEVQSETERGDGWRQTPGNIQLHDTLGWWAERNAEKQNIQRCFFSAAILMTPLPEVSKGHQEANLQTSQHGDTAARKETLCRGNNSCKTPRGNNSCKQAHSWGQIRRDPNSWAVEDLPNGFSHLHHQNLKASVDTAAAHHNVCGK